MTLRRASPLSTFRTDEDQQGLRDRAGQRREGRDGLDSSSWMAWSQSEGWR